MVASSTWNADLDNKHVHLTRYVTLYPHINAFLTITLVLYCPDLSLYLQSP